MRQRVIYFTMLAILLAIIASPLFFSWYSWSTEPVEPLDVVALDKTVPLPSYREHKGLYWLMAHRHIVRPEGRPYRLAWDYYGYRPLPDHKYQLRPLPTDLKDPDLVYCVDTYGVYVEDIEPGLAALGRRSEPVQGGLEMAEYTAMANAFKRPGTTLIAEFNSFASPTKEAPRRAMENLVGVRWDGWTARYFQNLADPGDVPVWLRNAYGRRYAEKWNAKGPGYAFVHLDGRIVILREPEDVEPVLPRVKFTKEALARYGVEDNIPYTYWFDLLEALPGTEVLAHHHLVPTPRGKRTFAQAGLPNVFPAVVRRTYKDDRTSYYFAGDFSDVGEAASTYKLNGQEWFFRTMAWWPAHDPQTFYWKVYVPLVGTILEDVVAARARRVKPPLTRVRGSQDGPQED